MGRESVPEFRPTRERMTWYPRNAGFKRAKAEDEVARMVAAARARGLDEASVDSFYQRMGTQEFADFERHNGFHHDVCEAGLLMEQHKMYVNRVGDLGTSLMGLLLIIVCVEQRAGRYAIMMRSASYIMRRTRRES